MDLLLNEPRDTAAARRLLKQASRRHGLPETLPLDGSAAKAAALQSDSEAHGPPISLRPGQDCHTVVEQEHRAVQRVTRPMVGGKRAPPPRTPWGGWNSCP